MGPMRHLFLTTFLLFPLTACDDPGSGGKGGVTDRPKELAEQLDLCDDADLEIAAECVDDVLALSEVSSEAASTTPAPPTWDLTTGGFSAWKCHCWTTCSSSGNKWTKSYFVGSYGTKKSCHNHAKSFCHGKSPNYDFANSGCGTKP